MLYTTQNNWEQVVQFKRDIYDTDRLKCTEINILSDLNIKVRLYTAHILFWASLVAQRLKCLPGMQETQGSIPGLGRSPGEGNGNPLQYSCLENPMDRGAWRATVHGVAESDTTVAT